MSFTFRLKRLFAREQMAFLMRPRSGWENHLGLARGFIGSALENADPTRSVLILGAGWGIEVPWKLAPIGTFGWDADPFSRLGTWVRHRRRPQWVFDDLTGSFAELDRVSRRVQVREGMWVPRPADAAARRLAGLLPSIPCAPMALEAWIGEYRPGTIICANVLGQIKPAAHSIVEMAFKPRDPWVLDTDLNDPLREALDAWTAKVAKAVLAVLGQSGSSLYLLHDRGVVHEDADVSLGEWTDDWTKQLRSEKKSLEVSDPLPDVNVLEELAPRTCREKTRWIWPLGPAQLHVMEAVSFRANSRREWHGCPLGTRWSLGLH
jgi:hypothetical protein